MSNLKVPPNAKDLEAMVIGLILQYPDCWSTVQSMLQPRDFYVAANASIFRLALDLDARGQAVDAVTVSELANAKGAEHLLSHLAECVESAFSPGNVAAYARIIRDHRVSRDMLAASNTLGQLAYGDDPVESRVIAAQAAALAIGDESATGEPVSIGKALSGVVEALESRRGEDPIGISTGFECLDARWRGINPGHLIVIAGRPAMGKELPSDTPIRTPEGWKNIGGLVVGDVVASIDGKQSVVTGVFPQGVKRMWELTFQDGRTIRAGREHLWSVRYRDWDGERVLSTEQLAEKLTYVRYRNRLSIALCSGDFGQDPEEGYRIHPWLVGALIGDGCLSNNFRFVSADQHCLDRFNSLLPDSYRLKHVANYDYSIVGAPKPPPNRCPLRVELDRLGLWGKTSGEKRIPAEYLEGSKPSRIALLQGLMDTDGTIDKTTKTPEFSTASKHLADDFVRLVRSLGGRAVCKRRKIKGGRYQDSYRIRVAVNDVRELFTLPRKRDIAPDKHKCAPLRLVLKSVTELDESVSAHCISVSHPSRLYIASHDYVVTHNTTLALNIAEHVARTRRVLFFSLEMGADELIEKTLSNRAGVFYSDIRDASFWDNREQYDRFTRALPDVGALDLSIDETGSIAMPQIRARARRHAHTNPVDLIVIDYLQLIAKERGVSTYDHVTECSRQTKLLAKELGCSVILLSQLNRKCDERSYGKNRPVMSDLRDSGSIEQDADIIAFTYRDVVYNENTNAPHIAECITAKQRRGISGTDYLREEFNCSRFVDHSGAKPTYGPAVRAAAGFDA